MEIGRGAGEKTAAGTSGPPRPTRGSGAPAPCSGDVECDVYPQTVDPPGACDYARNVLCPVPTVDQGPVPVTVPAPCDGDIECDVYPQTVDPPGTCAYLDNVLCPVPTVDQGPVPVTVP